MNIKRIKTDLIAICLIVFMVFAIFTVGYTIGEKKTREKEWLNNRVVVSVCVESGDTLDGLCSQYKPSWLDIREYRHDVKQLNSMNDSTIYAGDTILLYAYDNN